MRRKLNRTRSRPKLYHPCSPYSLMTSNFNRLIVVFALFASFFALSMALPSQSYAQDSIPPEIGRQKRSDPASAPLRMTAEVGLGTLFGTIAGSIPLMSGMGIQIHDLVKYRDPNRRRHAHRDGDRVSGWCRRWRHLGRIPHRFEIALLGTVCRCLCRCAHCRFDRLFSSERLSRLFGASRHHLAHHYDDDCHRNIARKAQIC